MRTTSVFGGAIMRRTFLAASAVLALGAGVGAAGADDQVSMRLDWLPSGYHAPIFLAVERGYYKDAGIDLTIQDGQGTNAALQAVIGGQDTFVIGNYSTMAQSIASGMELVGVAGLIQRLPDSIVSLESDPITTPKDMEGKTIATPPDSAGSKLLPAFMASAGVDASKVTVMNIASAQLLQSVLSGSAQGLTGWSFTDAELLRAQRPIAPPLRLSDYGINILGAGFIASKKTVAENPDLVKRFIAATAKGYEAGLADPEAAVAALVAARPLLDPALPLIQLKNFAPFMHSARTEGKPFGYTDREDWVQTIDLLKQYFEMKGDVDVDTVFTNDFVPAN